MNPEKIREMLKLGEGTTVEFKSSLRAKESIGKTICGFLNGSGGFIVCGIADQDDVVGTEESDEQITTFEKFIRESINPGALVTVQRERLERKSVIIIEVPRGSDPPYSFRHIHYVRVGPTIRVMDQEMIRDIVLRSQIEPERWERRFSTADPDGDLNLDEVQKAIREAEKVQRVSFESPESPMRVLQDLDVAKYGRLTNAGDVLFTTRPSARHPQVRIRAMRYNSDKAGEKFSDMKSLEGPLNRIFEEAYSFVVRNTPSVSHFRKGQPQREDHLLYPEAAIREGLINALAHRDYTSPSGGVAIHIYPKRLEIWNSGTLPEGITNESLRKGQISVLRNPDIAHVLYLRGFMEKAGRGSVLIIKACKRQGLPEPQWASGQSRGVTLTFFAPEATPEVTPEATPEVTPEVERLLQHLEGEMSRRELQETMGLKDDEHFRKSYLLPALATGVIEMTIPEKPRSGNQKYRLSARGTQLIIRGGAE